MMLYSLIRYTAALGSLAVLLSSCGLRRHPYQNPITKDTQQPDKVLFDKAISDLEHSKYEISRLTLQTLINTYDTSEYLAKAKLAIADSWYREGGAHGLAQAEAEYKDFILFYPQMEEAAEAQERVCDIHYKQMEKADRDPTHAQRAEDECRQLLVQFPNSKFAPEAQQKMREIQEVLADAEFRVGSLYRAKGSFPAAANRLQGAADQFPLFSRADDALWYAAEAYVRMGDRFENQQAADYTRIVKDYPLSAHAEDAKSKLQAMNRPVPEADPAAMARMKYQLENQQKPGPVSRALGIFQQHPDVRIAAKSGTPVMQGLRPTIPVSVPAGAAGAGGINEVNAAVVTDTSALDKNPDARANPPEQVAATAPADAATPGTPAAQAQGPLPTNHAVTPKKQKKAKKSKQQTLTPDATTPPAPAAQPQP
jgi:outer membrane protein assembly factor BamD